MKTINIGKDFSDTPLGRVFNDGPFNGERFREEFLKPALDSGDEITIEIDDAEGYGSSFLDEAFGKLVEKGYATAAELERRLHIVCVDPSYFLYRDLIWKYIKAAKRR